MQGEDRVRLTHMIEAAESALRFAAGRGRTDLDSDEMLRFAITHAVEIIGEAASRISEPPAPRRRKSRGVSSSRCATGSFTRTSISIGMCCGQPSPKRFPEFCRFSAPLSIAINAALRA